MRICIVTPDIVGPIKNGGIGTYAHNLTRLLHAEGHEITIIFTSVPEKRAEPGWDKWFSRRGIPFLHFSELPEMTSVPVIPHWDWFMERSWRIYSWLRNEAFDIVHFQDWGANGFHSIQAKAAGLAFPTTHLCVTLHSPSQWCTQGMAEWPEQAFSQLRLNYCEKFCAEYADFTISPSQHMLDWISSQKWVPQHESIVLQNPFFADNARSETDQPDTGHLIFFGRLESRKGLSLFCDALRAYFSTEPEPVVHEVTFLGKEMSIDEMDASSFIRSTIGDIERLSVNIVTNLNTFEALEYIKESRGVVVMPSTIDNFPYTLVECIVEGIPLYCSNAGGMREICDPAKLFEPTRNDLIRVMRELGQEWNKSFHQYDPEQANQTIINWHKERSSTPALQPLRRPDPKFSVIISYFNHPEYLEDTLQCLLKNNLEGHEVIIINDGSTEAEANQAFSRLSEDPQYAEFRFINESVNRGLGGARNYAITHAKGDWLLFHDSDNCAKPFMLDDFKRAVRVTSADILTCHYQSFSAVFNEETASMPYNYFRPYGNFTAIGLFENIFGDANFAVRKSTFFELGCFTDERNVYEDWNFLVKAAMNDKEILVIPKVLYWYRRNDNSMVRTLNNYRSHINALEAYLDRADPVTRLLLRDIAIPLYHENYRLGKAWGKLNKKLRKLIMSQVPKTRVSRPPRKFWEIKLFRRNSR